MEMARRLVFCPAKANGKYKDGPDRIWTTELGNEVWILQDESQLFTTPPNTELPIAAAFVDDVDQVSIELPPPLVKRLPTRKVKHLELSPWKRHSTGNGRYEISVGFADTSI